VGAGHAAAEVGLDDIQVGSISGPSDHHYEGLQALAKVSWRAHQFSIGGRLTINEVRGFPGAVESFKSSTYKRSFRWDWEA
jgi:hypothetical protein